MSKFSMGLKYWLQIFLVPIYLLSFLFPRKKNIWLYGSTFGKRFADSPKYFYLYMNQYHGDKIRSIWITKNKKLAEELRKQNYEAYELYSFKGMFYASIGGVYLYDNYTKDISFWLSGRAKKINLWHGIPLKKINMDNIYDKVRHPKTFMEKARYALRRMSDERPSHYVVATSEFLSDIFSSAFATRKVIISGYPRNDVLISDVIEDFTEKADASLDWMEKRKEEGKRIITYMPTFRESEVELFKVMDFSEFDEYLKNNNMVLCVKAHPKSAINRKLMLMESENHFKQIKVIDSGADPYHIVKRTDCLITDYSSIYFDYLLLNRKIIFFPYDYEEYLQNSRELYFDYDLFTPGQKVYSMKELEVAIITPDESEPLREEMKRRMFEHPENISSEDFYRKVCEIASIR